MRGDIQLLRASLCGIVTIMINCPYEKQLIWYLAARSTIKAIYLEEKIMCVNETSFKSVNLKYECYPFKKKVLKLNVTNISPVLI